MSEKSRVEKTFVEAEKAVAEARRIVAQVEKRIAESVERRVYLAEGKINKYGNLYLPKKFFEQTGLPRRVDIPVKMYLEENQLILRFPESRVFSRENA